MCGEPPAVFPLTVEDNLKMGAFMPEARPASRAAEFVFDCFRA